MSLTSSYRGAIALFLILIFATPIITSYAQNVQNNTLNSHWVPGWGFRDELNSSDIDHENFWADNAGKILTMATITGDTLDANRALWFIQNYARSDYLPETVVNSSLLTSNGMITNRIVSMNAVNGSDLRSLVVGNYYASELPISYLGSDRILINGAIYRSSSSTVYQVAPNEFVKKSTFSTTDGTFYSYVNATIPIGSPYIQLSIQVLPESFNLSPSDLIYLQAFASTTQFSNASLYEPNGSFVRPLVLNNGSPSLQNGTIIAYSKNNVFSQDALALSFSNASAQVDDFEFWQNDASFDNLGWMGVAFNAPKASAGSLTSPIYAKIYPIEHLDYRLVNDTARYIALSVNDTTVSPPVSFGFDAYGLALAAEKNSTLQSFAKSYWNFYYSRYTSFNDYPSSYARSIDTFALAGFTLYGCNSTIEDFTRAYLGNASGNAIEETGWAVDALYHLSACTDLPSDLALYRSALDTIGIGGSNFVISTQPNVPPTYTYQYAEAAAGLMLGGVPYNSPVVLALMNAVFQSNVSGTVLNQPIRGDLANTETLPAYMLSTWLFDAQMANQTHGYYVTGLSNVNLTSIDYSTRSVVIGGEGSNGTVIYANPNGSMSAAKFNGFSTFDLAPITSDTITSTVSSSFISKVTVNQTVSETVATTITQTTSLESTKTVTVGFNNQLSVDLLIVSLAVFLCAGALTLVTLRRKK